MNKFEVVKRFDNVSPEARPSLPRRATAGAAGYDFEVAEDTLIPSYANLIARLPYDGQALTLDEIARETKNRTVKPTLVPTGIKCKLDDGYYLELSVRSSLPLKHWLILANGVGIIDSDYYGNESNDGEIMFQLINLSPYDILLRNGDRIGQGIIKQYSLVEGDSYYTGEKRKGGFGSTSNTWVFNIPNTSNLNIEPKTIEHKPPKSENTYITSTTTNTQNETYYTTYPIIEDICINDSQNAINALDTNNNISFDLASNDSKYSVYYATLSEPDKKYYLTDLTNEELENLRNSLI